MGRFWNRRNTTAPTWMDPPPSGELRFDPSVRTAGELAGITVDPAPSASEPQHPQEVRSAAA